MFWYDAYSTRIAIEFTRLCPTFFTNEDTIYVVNSNITTDVFFSYIVPSMSSEIEILIPLLDLFAVLDECPSNRYFNLSLFLPHFTICISFLSFLLQG